MTSGSSVIRDARKSAALKTSGLKGHSPVDLNPDTAFSMVALRMNAAENKDA